MSLAACSSSSNKGSNNKSPNTANSTCIAATWTSIDSSGTVAADPAMNFGPSESFSVGFWATISSTATTTQHLLLKGSNATNEWSVTYEPSKGLCFNRQGQTWLACAQATVGEWHHYLVTYGNGATILYEDGGAIGSGNGYVGTPAATTLVVGNASTTGDNATAGDPPGNYNFIGSMSDLALWGTVVSSSDAAALAQSTKAPEGIAGLVAHWPLDDGSGTAAMDVASTHDMSLLHVSWQPTCP